MVSIIDLWLPIILAGIGVFVVSSIIHMLLTYHRSNMSQLPGEDKFREVMRSLNVPPGEYMVPYCGSPDAMNSDEYKQKVNEGPVGWMTVLPNGPWPMGKSLLTSFIYSLIVGFFAAYIAVLALPAGAEYLQVMRITGVVAFCCYGIGLIQNSIWWGRKWSTTVKFLIDALIYGLVTGGFFGWLWPAA